MPDLTVAAEAELLRLAREGRTDAFGELVTRNRQSVYMQAFMVVRNEDDALDLTQETFLRAFRSLASFDGRHSLASWLGRIATNAAIDLCRARNRRPQEEIGDVPFVPDPASRTTPAGFETPGRSLERAEIRSRIESAFGQLSPEHRAAISMKEIEGLSYSEIAERLGCSLGTVMSRLFYARKKLQSLLGDLRQ